MTLAKPSVMCGAWSGSEARCTPSTTCAKSTARRAPLQLPALDARVHHLKTEYILMFS